MGKSGYVPHRENCHLHMGKFSTLLSRAGHSLYLEALQHERGEPSTEEDRNHDDAEGGGEDELALRVLGVAYGESEGNGPPQPRKHQHVLETEADLLGASQVEEEREDVDVDQPSSKDGHLGVVCTVKGKQAHTYSIANSTHSYRWSCGQLTVYQSNEYFIFGCYVSRYIPVLDNRTQRDRVRPFGITNCTLQQFCGHCWQL